MVAFWGGAFCGSKVSPQPPFSVHPKEKAMKIFKEKQLPKLLEMKRSYRLILRKAWDAGRRKLKLGKL